jgi:hypothetical protein
MRVWRFVDDLFHTRTPVYFGPCFFAAFFDDFGSGFQSPAAHSGDSFKNSGNSKAARQIAMAMSSSAEKA